ncbi:Aldo/keto reductase [Schizophyllum commune H4-8]|uniref:NADP-dependent oxidoreductase domain-containing protein n=1 Tax=Schizophyllum commune (strain H4-8 / FGSC 9210) TaxID=578458 RepID=D8Q885_SCHCM|nr:Aldo/keto reductase [Schizophyllum commune H4-8]KAI5891164.1 Aldo/keto reductase [Schizophyllum commune H4-8]
MSLGRTLTLNDGRTLPLIGLGTWLSAPGEVKAAVEHALKVGYRHIDAALIYENQEEVGAALKTSPVPREQLWITSKLWNNSHRPELVEKDLDLTLKQLGLDYLDLYLIHWPVPFPPGETLSTKKADGTQMIIDTDAPSIVETWKAMIEVQKTGKAKSIGVSNFTVEHLEKIIKATGVVPAMNQIEAHPALQQTELEKYCEEKGIKLTAYSPLGNNISGKARIIDSPLVQELATKQGRDPAQILIAWCAHKGMSVIPKSVTPSRIESNFRDTTLTEEEFQAISQVGLKEPIRYNVPFNYKVKWDINIFDTEDEKKATHKVW